METLCHGLNFAVTPNRIPMQPIDGNLFSFVVMDNHQLEGVDRFCLVGGTVCLECGCLSSITKFRSAWNKFRELLSLSSSGDITLHTTEAAAMVWPCTPRPVMD